MIHSFSLWCYLFALNSPVQAQFNLHLAPKSPEHWQSNWRVIKWYARDYPGIVFNILKSSLTANYFTLGSITPSSWGFWKFYSSILVLSQFFSISRLVFAKWVVLAHLLSNTQNAVAVVFLSCLCGSMSLKKITLW